MHNSPENTPPRADRNETIRKDTNHQLVELSGRVEQKKDPMLRIVREMENLSDDKRQDVIRSIREERERVDRIERAVERESQLRFPIKRFFKHAIHEVSPRTLHQIEKRERRLDRPLSFNELIDIIQTLSYQRYPEERRLLDSKPEMLADDRREMLDAAAESSLLSNSLQSWRSMVDHIRHD